MACSYYERAELLRSIKLSVSILLPLHSPSILDGRYMEVAGCEFSSEIQAAAVLSIRHKNV